VPTLHRPTIRRFGRHRKRGQGLVEFAIALPVLVLVMLIVVDAGRLFFSAVTLHNAARIAASFAAAHPDAWGVAPNAPQQAEYSKQILRDTAALCVPATIPDPTFPDGNKNMGSRAKVELSCDFRMITPVIGSIVGNIVKISASEVFPIRQGLMAQVPTFPTAAPTAAPTPTPTAAPTPTPPPGPTPTPTGPPTPTPLPPGVCVVPTIIGVKVDDVINAWVAAGFDPTLLNVTVAPHGNANYKVRVEFVGNVQSVWDGTNQQCASFRLTVGP
jgi:hypothetical protein